VSLDKEKFNSKKDMKSTIESIEEQGRKVVLKGGFGRYDLENSLNFKKILKERAKLKRPKRISYKSLSIAYPY